MTARAVVLGLGASCLLCGLTPYNDYKIAATYLAGNHLPLGSFALLCGLVLVVNVALRAVRPRLALAPGELLTIWAMTAVSSGLPSSGLFRYLTPHIIANVFFATPENGWAAKVLPHLPVALQITDPAAVKGFFEGLRGAAPIPWHLWVRPLVVYGVFAAALGGACCCLSVLLRRQWVEHERFTFPIVELPVELVEEPRPGQLLPPLLRHPATWAAIVLLTIVHTLNGLHRIWPALPQIDLYGFRVTGLAGRGWRTLNGLWMPVYPLAVGFSYLLSNEVLLSLWVFHLVYRGELIGADLLGITPQKVGASGYGFETFASQQAAGAALALTAWMLYAGRRHYLSLLRRLAGGPPLPGEDAESLSYRAAGWGLLAALVVMFAWLVRMGGQPLMALAVLTFGGASFVTLTWLVAQGGLLFVQPVWAGREVAIRLFGSGAFTPRAILVASQIEHICYLDLREFLLPHLLNVQKAADPYRTDRRGLLAACALALAAGFLVSAYTTIKLPYDHGAAVGLNNIWTYNMSPQLPLKFLESLLNQPQAPAAAAWWNVGGGFAGMWLVMLLRTSLAGFRLHPAGFIICSGYPLRCFWTSFLVGWLVKNAILRAGGLRLYRQARPFFLGLVIGDCLNGALWAVVSAALHVRYAILPG